MKKRFLEGEQVLLRAVEPEDLDFLYRIENDPELWDVSNFSVPYSKFVLKQYIAANQYDIFADKQLRLMIQHCETGRTIGTLDITDFSIQHSHGSVGIALLKEYRNKGLGKEALSLLCDYAFNFLHLHQLYAYIGADNITCQSLFRSCLFTSCGILKDWLHVNNQWADVLLVKRLADDDISTDK